ncbi:MAG TPA: hypothetical protein VMA77_03210 [Solirubrobacteraceae bacterium]|nr:hypothetical protein [Solirubrobacteraceae bacterium]
MIRRDRLTARTKTGLVLLGVTGALGGALAPAASALNPQPLPPYQHPPLTAQIPIDPA